SFTNKHFVPPLTDGEPNRTERNGHFDRSSLAHSSVLLRTHTRIQARVDLEFSTFCDFPSLNKALRNLVHQQKAGLAAIKDQKWTDVLWTRRRTIRSLYLGKALVCPRSWNNEQHNNSPHLCRAPIISKQVKKAHFTLRMRFIPPWTLSKGIAPSVE
ncbi:hypothetical protein BT69DRAFT_1291357, partial [Atractiella rhizophila]